MPTIPRLFVRTPLAVGREIAVSRGQVHYLGTVLRRVVGDQVSVFNGMDGEWHARISQLSRDHCTLLLDTLTRPQMSDADLCLAFALLKRDATDLVVQKATELGVSEIQPVMTERTNAGRVNEARLLSIAIEAAEQSDRLTVPTLHSLCTLTELLVSWPAGRPLFVAIERSRGPFLRHVAGQCGLLVGPEGGFSPVELNVLNRYPFVAPVSLGSRVLRAETACLAGLVLLRAPGCG